MVITSNRAPSDWYPLFPNPVVAEFLLDRVINNSHQVIMNGPSYRPNKRPKSGAAKDDSPKNRWPAFPVRTTLVGAMPPTRVRSLGWFALWLSDHLEVDHELSSMLAGDDAIGEAVSGQLIDIDLELEGEDVSA